MRQPALHRHVKKLCHNLCFYLYLILLMTHLVFKVMSRRAYGMMWKEVVTYFMVPLTFYMEGQSKSTRYNWWSSCRDLNVERNDCDVGDLTSRPQTSAPFLFSLNKLIRKDNRAICPCLCVRLIISNKFRSSLLRFVKPSLVP
jgi:hypothetical protein